MYDQHYDHGIVASVLTSSFQNGNILHKYNIDISFYSWTFCVQQVFLRFHIFYHTFRKYTCSDNIFYQYDYSSFLSFQIPKLRLVIMLIIKKGDIHQKGGVAL